MRPPRLCLPALLILPLCGFLPASAQNAAPPPVSHPRKKSATKKTLHPVSRSANVKKGEIVALDAEQDTLTLKDAAGQTTAYGFSEKTRWFKAKHPVQPMDFKPGDAAVAHLRRSRADGSLTLTELTDPPSWDWLTALRRETTTAVVTTIAEDALTATVGTDAAPITYLVSEKTRWSKGGKEAAPSDFKAGETVVVVPRSLPSGAIMARVVADTPDAAARWKERLARTVHGTVSAIDSAAHRFTLATAAGDVRVLRCDETTELRQGAKTLPPAALKPGLRIAASLRPDKDTGDLTFAWRLRIETARGKKAARGHTRASSRNPIGRSLPGRTIPGKLP